MRPCSYEDSAQRSVMANRQDSNTINTSTENTPNNDEAMLLSELNNLRLDAATTHTYVPTGPSQEDLVASLFEHVNIQASQDQPDNDSLKHLDAASNVPYCHAIEGVFTQLLKDMPVDQQERFLLQEVHTLQDKMSELLGKLKRATEEIQPCQWARKARGTELYKLCPRELMKSALRNNVPDDCVEMVAELWRMARRQLVATGKLIDYSRGKEEEPCVQE